MRHRCSPWNQIPYLGGGWGGGMAENKPEILWSHKIRSNSALPFDMTLLIISIRIPIGVLEHSPENSWLPGDMSVLWAPRLFLHCPFICIYFRPLVTKSLVQHIKSHRDMQQHHRNNSGALFVLHHHLWSFHLDLVFKHVLMSVEPGKAGAL